MEFPEGERYIYRYLYVSGNMVYDVMKHEGMHVREKNFVFWKGMVKTWSVL